MFCFSPLPVCAQSIRSLCVPTHGANWLLSDHFSRSTPSCLFRLRADVHLFLLFLVAYLHCLVGTCGHTVHGLTHGSRDLVPSSAEGTVNEDDIVLPLRPRSSMARSSCFSCSSCFSSSLSTSTFLSLSITLYYSVVERRCSSSTTSPSILGFCEYPSLL